MYKGNCGALKIAKACSKAAEFFLITGNQKYLNVQTIVCHCFMHIIKINVEKSTVKSFQLENKFFFLLSSIFNKRMYYNRHFSRLPVFDGCIFLESEIPKKTMFFFFFLFLSVCMFVCVSVCPYVAIAPSKTLWRHA